MKMTVAPSRNPVLDLSFEFFPPKSPEGAERLVKSARELAVCQPNFFSVTYGAAGSTQKGTPEAVEAVREASGRLAAAHLTAAGAARSAVDAVARDFVARGIDRIVALRGDARDGAGRYEPHPQGYRNAADLVAGLKRIHDFDISVAAYPEVHPDSPSPEADVDNLKAKLDAGATRAITQFFFEPEMFLRFRDRVTARGIYQPIVPGIMPIRDLDQIRRFADGCGATVPASVAGAIEAAGEERAERRRVAIDLTVDLCVRLMRHGVDAFHFYTLNHADMSLAIVERLLAEATGSRAALHGAVAG